MVGEGRWLASDILSQCSCSSKEEVRRTSCCIASSLLRWWKDIGVVASSATHWRQLLLTHYCGPTLALLACRKVSKVTTWKVAPFKFHSQLIQICSLAQFCFVLFLFGRIDHNGNVGYSGEVLLEAMVAHLRGARSRRPSYGLFFLFIATFLNTYYMVVFAVNDGGPIPRG